MTEPIWSRFLTERDQAVFAASGYGARGGFGRRPALLVIDVNWAFCGDKPEPILESIKRWRNSCGEDAWLALPYIKSLIDKCRQKGIPVIYTTGERRPDNCARIAFGTDMGVGPHGQNAREFGYMVEAGMPSREAIKAATVNAANLLDLSDEVGTIASGKSADVIAVDSSPLDDVSVLERVVFVIARGDVYRA